MLGLLVSRLAPWALVVAAALALTGAAYRLGGRDARQEADGLRGQIEVQRKMEDAGEDVRARDDDSLLDWLRQRGQ